MIRGAALAAAAVAVALVLACGGKRAPTPVASGHDAGDAGLALDAGAPPTATVDAAVAAGTAPDYQVIDVSHAGSAKVTVSWPDASAAMRRSPGRTACGTERPPRARIGTLHGVADVVVMLSVMAGKPPPPAAPLRVIARDCAFTPRVAVAPGLGGALEIQSGDEAAQTVVATGLGQPWGAAPAARPLARAHLPMLGHTVALPLDALGAIALGGVGDDPALIVAPPTPYVAVTDETGVARFDAVPPGSYPVMAWLPPAAGQPAILASGTVTVAADAEAALTLTLAP